MLDTEKVRDLFGFPRPSLHILRFGLMANFRQVGHGAEKGVKKEGFHQFIYIFSILSKNFTQSYCAKNNIIISYLKDFIERVLLNDNTLKKICRFYS